MFKEKQAPYGEEKSAERYCFKKFNIFRKKDCDGMKKLYEDI